MVRYQQSCQFEEDPQPDVGRVSKWLCISGLAFCWLIGILSLVIGVYLFRTGGILVSNGNVSEQPFTIPGGIATSFNKYAQELFPLGLNILVTICTDITGYIHTVSLRWALQKESRLTFNSNLRLFTSARLSKANAWYTNLIMAVFMIMSYASTSLIFIRETNVVLPILPPNKDIFICAYAIITLAIGILGQATIAAVCLPSLVKAPSWSSDPLEIAAACVVMDGLHHRPGRCMRSVHESKEAAQPISPSRRQRSALSAHREVSIVFRCMWIPVILAVTWGGVIMLVLNTEVEDGLNNGNNWSLFPNVDPTSVDTESQTPSVSIFWSQGAQTFDFGGFCWALSLIGLIQATMTLSLHSAELMVNTIRDEMSWRKAAKGGRRRSNVLSSMLGSFPALVLFILKPVIHWLYSLANSVYFSDGVCMKAPQIFYLGGGTAVLAIFTTICAFWRPKGPQPAAFGHLQTLADLVDMWPNVNERMFWGQKGLSHLPAGLQTNTSWTEFQPSEALAEQDAMLRDNGHIWHAGTAVKRLEPVDFGKKYMGIAAPCDFAAPKHCSSIMIRCSTTISASNHSGVPNDVQSATG